jgi:glycosyltransferase involved in cell wall biosynthesis
LKTLQIIDNLIPDSSEGRRVITIANELTRRGHMVTVASAFKDEGHAEKVERLLEPGVEILWHHPVFRFSKFYYSPDLYGLLSGGDYDVVHAHSYRHYGTYVGSLLRKKRNTPFVLSPYGSAGYGSSRKHMPLYLIQDFITRKHPLRYADRILANTLYEKGKLVDLGAEPDKIDVVYREIDTELFRKVGEAVDYTVLYVGRVTPIKGIELLMEAMVSLRDSFRLVIVGPVEDLGYYMGLRRMARSNGLESRIEFKGEVRYGDIPSYLSQVLVVVLPSLYENLGGVLLEAQACECPVIGMDTGGIGEVVKDGETGFLLSDRNGASMAEKIELLAQDPEMRREMGKAGRKMVLQKFNKDTYVKKIIDSYETILKPS